MLSTERKEQNSMKQLLHSGACKLSMYSSLHGLAWYNRTENKFLKGLILVSSFIVVATLPLLLISEAIEFKKSVKTTNLVEWKIAKNISYPSITICNPKFFDKTLLERYNISDDLANFMMISVDKSRANFSKYVENAFPEGLYQQLTDTNQASLNEILQSNNFTDMLELFEAVAIRCEAIVTFCDAHKVFYGDHRDDDLSCCAKLFNSKPFFTIHGTCYSTKVRRLEVNPSIYNSLVMWISSPRHLSPGMSMLWRGSKAVAGEGAVWAITDRDTPGQAILSGAQKLATGDLATVGLKIFQIDRSELNWDCVNENETFYGIYGLHSTRPNCLFLQDHFLHDNCSIAIYNGVKPIDKGMKPCTPVQAMQILKFSTAHLEKAREIGYDPFNCKYECVRTEYTTSITKGKLDSQALKDYLSTIGVPYDETFDSSMVLEFYFEAFEYPKHILVQEGFLDFMSKVGGWMGLALGASVCSIMELVGFIFMCFRNVWKHMTHQSRIAT